MNWRNIIFIFFIGLLGRMLPHPENMTPFHALCVLSGIYLPTRSAIYTLLASYGIADLFLAFGSSFSIWGSWSFYTYTGVLGLVYLGTKIRKRNLQIPLTLIGSLCFWLWTNLGVWIHSGMYLKTMAGFISCYVAAIPFLQKALLGDLIWFATLSLIFPWIISNVNRKMPKQAKFRPVLAGVPVGGLRSFWRFWRFF